MNAFDKACAVFAFALGVVFLLGGSFGLFIGFRAWVALPPVVGLLPAFAGWGIVRAVYLAWRVKRPSPTTQPEAASPIEPKDAESANDVK